MPDTTIDVYSWPTPNGHKVHIMLEECALPYRAHPINIGKGDQFDPAFLAISPNNKIPAITDPQGPDGRPISLFESGAILVYLAGKTGKFLPTGDRERYAVLQWLMFQMGSVGPMLGQAHHFRLYAPEKLPYAIDRYTHEVQRLLGVLDKQLDGRDFVAGGEYSIADMAIYPWINPYDGAPLDMTPYPNIRRWHAAIAERPATARAYALKQQVNPNAGKPLSDEERKHLFGKK